MRATLAAMAALLCASSQARAEAPKTGEGVAVEETPKKTSVLTLGMQYRTIYGTPTWLATTSLGLTFPRFDVALHAGRGETSSSLFVTDVAASLYLHRSPWRGMRLGPSAAVGVLGVERVTNDSALMIYYARVSARGEVDLATTRFAPLLSLDIGAAGPQRALSVAFAIGGRF